MSEKQDSIRPAEPEVKVEVRTFDRIHPELLLRHHQLETKELIAKVMDSVVHWTCAEEMPDDMTVLVARVH